jgi:hypothetical protein
MRARLVGSSAVVLTACLAIATSCGRFGFDQTASLGSGDAPADVPRLVAMTGSSTGDGSGTFSMLQVTIPPVTAGNLVVVAIADHSGAAVSSVVDAGGHPFASTGARAAQSFTASEVWYEANAAPTTSVTVAMTPASNFNVWVAEFTGVQRAPPAVTAHDCLQYPPTIVAATVTTTVANELVFSVTMCAAPLYVDQAQPPFSSLPPLSGNGAGYYVAPTPGTYGTSFDIASGSGMNAMTCASSAAWLPGP